MANDNLPKIILTSKDASKQVHLISKGETNATIVIPSSKKDVITNATDDNNTFSFMNVEDLEKLIREQLDCNLNIDTPEIIRPVNLTTNYNGGIELASYRLPNLPNDRIVTTHYQFSTSPIFTTILKDIVKQGDNLINLSQQDLIDAKIFGGDDIDYYVRVRVFCNAYSSEFSNVVKFRYAPSAYVQPTIWKLKFQNSDLKTTGTELEREYINQQSTVVKGEIRKTRNVERYARTTVKQGLQMPTVDYDNTTYFPSNNGILNYVIHALGLHDVRFRSLSNIPSFAFSFTEISNLIEYENKRFIASGEHTVDVFEFDCKFKSGLMVPQEHKHVLSSNILRTYIKNNKMCFDKHPEDEINQLVINNGTDVDLFNLIPRDISILRHSKTFLESGDVLTNMESDIIYFVNKNKEFHPDEFTGFNLFEIIDPRVPQLTSPIVNEFKHIERDPYSNQLIKIGFEVNHHVENLNWLDEITGMVGYPGEINPDPDENPVDPDQPIDPTPPVPQEDLDPNYDNYNPDTMYYTGRLDLYFTPSRTQCGDPGIPNIIEVEFREPTFNITKLFTYPYQELQAELFMQLVPLEVIPGYTYDVRFRFNNTETGVISPWSNVRRLEIPSPKLFLLDLNIAGKSNGILTNNPTIGLTDIVSDYDILNLVYKEPKWIDGIEDHPYRENLNKLRLGNLKYNFSILTTTGVSTEIYNKVIYKPIDSISNYLYKGVMFTIDTIAENVNINASTQYNIVCRVDPVDELKNEIPSHFLTGRSKSEKVQTTSMTQTVPTDDLTTPITTFSKCKYYGEITVSNLMPNIRYRGYYTIGLKYEVNDEVSFLEEGSTEPSIYICLGKHVAKKSYPDVNSNYFVKITDNNYKKYYKSGIPSYSWLSERIGLPLLARNKVFEDGTIDSEIYCSDILNPDGWIKVQNQLNNILYIAKKPFVSKLPYSELQKRFLTGHNSRTIRIGKFYYNVRLLESNPNSIFKDKFVSRSDTAKLNDLSEQRLYESLFNRSFVNASIGDLGFSKNDNETFIAGGKVNTIYKDSLTKVSFTELNDIEKEQSNDNYFYRPVLELVKEDYLPFRKAKSNIPGSPFINYDKWSDIGYFDVIDSSELLTPSEINKMFDLGLNVYNDDIYYHKFYYHGLIMFIPNKPIGDNVDFTKLLDKKVMYGEKYLEGNVINKIKFSIMCPDLSSSFTDVENFSPNSIVTELISRIDRNYDNCPEFTNYQFDVEHNRRNIDLEDVIFKNIESRDNNLDRYTIKNNQITKVSINEKGKFLPIIVMEAFDFDTDISYTEVDYGEPTVTYKEVTYRPTVLVEKQVEKIVPVVKTTKYTEQVLVQIKKEQPTGVVRYKNISRVNTDNYGVVVSHIPKTEIGGNMRKLYGEDELNINLINNELTIGYSFGDNGKYSNFSDYLVKPLLANKISPLVPHYVAITKTFESAASCKSFIRSTLLDQVSLMSLTNSAYKYPNTSTDRKYPLGMILGSLSSKMSWFPVPAWFDLYNPDYNLEMRLNLSPNIILTEEGGNTVIRNSFNSVKDIKGNKLSIPLLSPYIPYENFSSDGKNIILPYIEYYIRLERPDIDSETLKSLVNTFLKDNLFTIVGFDFNNLYCLPDNGIISNGYTAATVTPFPPDYEMNKYFSSSTEPSLGKSLTDIFNPIAEINEWYEPGYVTVEKEKSYVDLEKRTFIEYVQEQGDPVTIKVPVISYNV